MDMFLDTNFWYAVSFLMFAAIVYKFGKGPFLNMLDTRIATIREDIQTAENLRIEAQELLAQYQRKHKDALEEAEGIVNKAKAHAEEIRAQAERDLDELIARREKQLQERFQTMEASAIAEIQAYAANLAIEATAEIIAEKLDKKTGETLLEESITAIGQQVH